MLETLLESFPLLLAALHFTVAVGVSFIHSNTNELHVYGTTAIGYELH